MAFIVKIFRDRVAEKAHAFVDMPVATAALLSIATVKKTCRRE
jgi:hypothetical protein